MKNLWQSIKSFIAGQSAKFRITIGLVALMTTLVLTADFLGLIPDRKSAVREGRVAVAEAVAVNTTAFITQSDLRRMEANLKFVVERNDDILSAAVRRKDGKAVATIGEHNNHWQVLESDHSTDSQLQVPIWDSEGKWGQVELRFQSLEAPGWQGFFTQPLFLFVSFLGFSAFCIYYFYLGRMLTQLNPSAAIPGRVRSTLDTIAEGLLVLDSRERVVLANQAFANLIGKAADDLLGYRASDFKWATTSGEKLDLEHTPWKTALAQGRPQMNNMLRLQTDSESWRTFMANCSPILGSGSKVGGVLVSFDDVTLLEEKEIELRKSKEEAERANQSKSDFLANMSHEIRTPMNAILGFTEVLKRGYGHGENDTRKHLNTIHSSGKHLLELINDILDLSKVEAGNFEVEQIECSPHAIIREMIVVLGVKAMEKGISLTFEPSAPIPEKIQSDPVRLRQIITNLVGNSIKFTEVGGVKVDARLVKNKGKDQLEIDVIDTGIGMTETQAASIFKPFEQADSSITRRFGGTGLGLSISKKFAEALGGDIVVRSEVGQGSTFTVVIDTGPLKGVNLLQPEEILKIQDEDEIKLDEQLQWQFPDSRVLVVDDGDENRALVKLVLEEVGLTIDVAEDGKQGSDMAFENDYDVILMDVSMPVMDGYAAASLMRERGLKMPVVALTAHAMGDVEQKCLAAGYSGFMTKPIDIDALLKMMAGYLGGTQQPVSTSISNGSTTIPPQQPVENDPYIVSSLSIDNPRIRTIVEKFIVRLSEQLVAMQKALQENDFSELAELAHWLKGAGGTVGFAVFTEPAKQLEQSAKQDDGVKCGERLAEIRQLSARLEIDRPDYDAAVASPKSENSISAQMPEKLVSSVLSGNPRMRPIIAKFTVRLNEQIGHMNAAWKARDYEQLASLAHWLKGAGGTVGFGAFTEPAKNLEQLAKEKNEREIEEALSILHGLADRIVMPDEEETKKEVMES